MLLLTACSSSSTSSPSTPSAPPTSTPTSTPASPSDVAGTSAPATPSRATGTTTGTIGGTAAPSTGSAAGDSPACTLRAGSRQLIKREVDPGSPAYAMLVDDVDLARCKHAWETLAVPPGPGYCVQLAWAADNPGYPVDAAKAPPLKRVIASKGAGCR